MRYSIPLLIAAFGLTACDAPIATEAAPLAPADAALKAGAAPIALLAGSAEIADGRDGFARITVNARATSPGSATGTFRIRTDTDELTGEIDCLEVRDGRATASGPVDPEPRRKASEIVIRVIDASVHKTAVDAAAFSTGVLKGKPTGCLLAKLLPEETRRGNFVVRGETGTKVPVKPVKPKP